MRITDLKNAIEKADPIIRDKKKVKSIMSDVFDIAVHSTNGAMKTGGWEALIAGSANNENFRKLYKNTALYVYTQILDRKSVV